MCCMRGWGGERGGMLLALDHRSLRLLPSNFDGAEGGYMKYIEEKEISLDRV